MTGDPDIEETDLLPGEKEELEAKLRKEQESQMEYAQRALRQACIDNDAELLEKILEETPEAILYTSNSGTTALHEAAHAGNIGIVERLLDIASEEEQRCLRSAQHQGPMGGGDEKNGNLQPREKGKTHKPIIQLQSVLDQLDVWGSNALHFAANRGHLDICQLLVERGIDMSRIRQDGKAAIHLARDRNHGAVLDFLYHEMLAQKKLKEAQSRSFYNCCGWGPCGFLLFGACVTGGLYYCGPVAENSWVVSHYLDIVRQNLPVSF